VNLTLIEEQRNLSFEIFHFSFVIADGAPDHRLESGLVRPGAAGAQVPYLNGRLRSSCSAMKNEKSQMINGKSPGPAPLN